MSLTSDIRRLESALRKKGFEHYGLAVRSARIVRDEVNKMLKAGVSLDLSKVKSLISNPKRLLKYAYDDASIRDLVRGFGKIQIGVDLMTGKPITQNYAKHLQAKANVDRYNKSVRMWNIMHRKEIEADIVEKRYEKRFSVGESPRETQESANAWYNTVLTAYSKPSNYYEARLAFYIQKVNQAMDNFVPVGFDWVYDFFNAKLNTLAPSGEDYYQIETYYTDSRTGWIDGLDKMAKHYSWYNEWDDVKRAHKKQIDDYKEWL